MLGNQNTADMLYFHEQINDDDDYDDDDIHLKYIATGLHFRRHKKHFLQNHENDAQYSSSTA